MSFSPSEYRHVNYGWDDLKVASMSAVERLSYRSNILGADQRITNTGGGNTSSKAMEVDPLTGEETEVLWVKGSGVDLRTCPLFIRINSLPFKRSTTTRVRTASRLRLRMTWWECIVTRPLT